MIPSLLFLAGFAVFLLILLMRTLRENGRRLRPDDVLKYAEESGRGHVTYFPQLRRALAPEDFVFLHSRSSHSLARKVRKERRRIALAYLSCLHKDFVRLWELARVIASFSRQVGVGQELERLRLGIVFSLRYRLLRAKFHAGFSPVPELGSLSEVVSRLAIRLETAMKDLGERAALASTVASTLDGRNLNTP